ncbi:zinc-binding dehydrogenase [uncultured Agrococcus sp.]|uniref:zinc-binding dehydrogenase n=1 Tax=uncultured Agrococcus sp. TaxID=382258 RepID=UPI0025EF47F6|nr:zinc-binding dehydrogenase [uncultured Agrococcus sp.]
MRAALVVSQNAHEPLEGLQLEHDHPAPEAVPGHTVVRVKAASLNPHDLWTLRGVGHPADRVPMILGCDGAGVTDDGREVVLHPVIGDAVRGGGDVTLDPGRALLSETVDGTLADLILVPDELLLDKPESVSFTDAACLGIAWGTAYRMLFTRAAVRPGDTVLVQGSSGGVSSAAIALARAAGATVFATSRTEEKRQFALEQGAHEVFENGARLPRKVDVVVETIGEATWGHSLRSVRPGGTVVLCGATTGAMPPAELNRVFYQQLSIIGSTACTRDEFARLLELLGRTGIRPSTETLSFDDIPAGMQRLIDGDILGKLVVDFDA